MHMKSFVFVLMLSVLVVAAPTQPPQPLHKVGDHWTPYDPPTEFPEGTDVYIIQPGDTLWNLAEQWLGDPFLWPQIWELNPYIKDAHWIYPGDPIVKSKPAEETPTEEVPSQPEETPVEEETPGTITEEAQPLTPYPLGTEKDMYCFARVDDPEMQYPLTISSAENDELKYELTEGDVVFITLDGETEVFPGDEFFIAEEGEIVSNQKGTLGKVWYLHGRLQVLCAQEKSATAIITNVCDAILRGYHLIPFEIVPVPTALPKELHYQCENPYIDPVGNIIFSADKKYSFGKGTPVLIDLGKKDNVHEGQYLRVFRTASSGDPIVLGRVGILQTFEKTSVGMVLESRFEMHPGDFVAPEE